MVNPWKLSPGAGKFEAAYAWPLIPTGVDNVQFTPIVGATIPKNVIDVKRVHSANVQFPMVVTLLGIVTDVREVQSANA
jgi:hypothetical protein